MYLYAIVGQSHKASWSLRCLPPRHATQADDLCSRRQLPLIVRQGSVDADLWCHGSVTGTPSKPRKNLIRAVAGFLPFCPPPHARAHLQVCDIQSSAADITWNAHEGQFSPKGESWSESDKGKSGRMLNSDYASPSPRLLPLNLFSKRWLRLLTLS